MRHAAEKVVVAEDVEELPTQHRLEQQVDALRVLEAVVEAHHEVAAEHHLDGALAGHGLQDVLPLDLLLGDGLQREALGIQAGVVLEEQHAAKGALAKHTNPRHILQSLHWIVLCERVQ